MLTGFLLPRPFRLVDTGRNPDLHTRSLLGRLANDNQQMLGQHMAMGVSIAQIVLTRVDLIISIFSRS